MINVPLIITAFIAGLAIGLILGGLVAIGFTLMFKN
jgi:hypothetical protein